MPLGAELPRRDESAALRGSCGDILQPAITGCNSFLDGNRVGNSARLSAREACRCGGYAAKRATTRPASWRNFSRSSPGIAPPSTTTRPPTMRWRRRALPAARHRPEQRIVQAKIARMRQLENGEVGELARRDDAGLVEAENTRAVGARQA